MMFGAAPIISSHRSSIRGPDAENQQLRGSAALHLARSQPSPMADASAAQFWPPPVSIRPASLVGKRHRPDGSDDDAYEEAYDDDSPPLPDLRADETLMETETNAGAWTPLPREWTPVSTDLPRPQQLATQPPPAEDLDLCLVDATPTTAMALFP